MSSEESKQPPQEPGGSKTESPVETAPQGGAETDAAPRGKALAPSCRDEPRERRPQGRRPPRTRTATALALRPAGRIHWVPIDPRRFELRAGSLVVTETDRGLSMARVLVPPEEVTGVDLSRHVRKVVRPAREPDLITHAEGKAREAELLAEVNEIATRARLDIRVLSVDLQAIGNKLTVFFASERRVDFRSLVRELSQGLGFRIEMRQIGVRDEAKLLGAIGHCGRELCCCTFLRNFAAVGIRMAKTQNLALSPNKVSGCCGRLMCCLAYEHEAYAELVKTLPKAGKRVLTKGGPGKVLSIDVLQQRFTFVGDDGIRKTLDIAELELGEDGKPIRPPIPAPPEAPRRGAPEKAPARSSQPQSDSKARPQPPRPQGDKKPKGKRGGSQRRSRGRGRGKGGDPRK